MSFLYTLKCIFVISNHLFLEKVSIIFLEKLDNGIAELLCMALVKIVRCIGKAFQLAIGNAFIAIQWLLNANQWILEK